MHHSSAGTAPMPEIPAGNGRRRFMSKRKAVYVGLLAAVIGGSGAGVASAHTLTREQAESSARWVAQQKVNDPRTPYTFSTAVCDADGVPHIRGCTLYYDTPATRATPNWACSERIQIYYQAHNAGDPPPNYTRYWRAKDPVTGNYFSHPC